MGIFCRQHNPVDVFEIGMLQDAFYQSFSRFHASVPRKIGHRFRLVLQNLTPLTKLSYPQKYPYL